MDLNRRRLIGAAGVAGALAISPDEAPAAPLTSTLGRDATQYGVRPGSPDDQTRVLQRAIDDAARGLFVSNRKGRAVSSRRHGGGHSRAHRN